MPDGLDVGPSADRPAIKRTDRFSVEVHRSGVTTSTEPITDAVHAIFSTSVSRAALGRLRDVHLNIYVVPAGERFSVLPRYAGWAGRPIDVPLESGGIGGFFEVHDVEVWVGGRLGSHVDVVNAPPHLMKVTTKDGTPVDAVFVASIVIREEMLLGRARHSVIIHELGHAVYSLMLTANQRTHVHRLYQQRLANGGPWIRLDAANNVREYFAEATSAFFSATPFSAEAIPERYTRKWIAEHDPKLYAYLRAVYPKLLPAVATLEARGQTSAA